MRGAHKNKKQKRRHLVHAVLAFLFVAVVFHSLDIVLIAQEKTHSLVDEYQKISEKLDDVIAYGTISEIKDAVETLHKIYDKNPYFFEVIKDIAYSYYMLGDFTTALFYTKKALKLRNDKNLQTLRLQLLMKTIRMEDITMNTVDAQEIQRSVTALLNNASYEADVLYAASVYFSVIGDEKNYRKIISQFRSLYGFDKRYQHILHMYSLIDAINRQNMSSESEKAFVALQNYDSQVWFVWLLLQYMIVFYIDSNGFFPDTKMLQVFNDYTERLIQSDIDFLQNAAYVMRFNFFFSRSEMQEARNVVERYSKQFPKNSNAWLRYGFVLYDLKDYGNALQAFLRADSDNDFVHFMYDATLKEALSVSYEGVKTRAEARVKSLIDAGATAFSRGDIRSAQKHARRALFIMPLSIQARILLSDIYIKQGYISQAEEELSLLENINGVPSRIIRQLESIRTEIRSEFDDYPAIRTLLDAGSFSRTSYDPIAWNVRIKTVEYNEHSHAPVLTIFDDIRYAESFFTKFFEYSLVKFPTMFVSHDGNTETFSDAPSIDLEFSYSEKNGIFSAQAHLVNAESLEHIATFIEKRDGNDRVLKTLDALAQRLYNALPTIVPVLAINGSTVILGNRNYTTKENFVLPIFDKGILKLSTQSPYLKSSGQLIGFARVEQNLPRSVVARLQTTIGANSSSSSPNIERDKESDNDGLNILLRIYGEKTFSLFDMRSRVNSGDVAVIFSTPWVDDTGSQHSIENLKQTMLLTTMRIPFR